MLYSSYDKEINEFQENLTESEIIALIKYIEINEMDRAAFYEFEDESGKTFDFWDLKRLFKEVRSNEK